MNERKSTKLTRPPIAVLRLQGIIIALCIDDLKIVEETYEECLTGSIKAIKTFLRWGFLIHPGKSIFLPKQKITYLGFILDSVNMLLSVTDGKRKYRSHVKKSLEIREPASLIGTLTTNFTENKLGPPCYRALDKYKTCSPKKSKGNFECGVTLSKDGLLDLKWWKDNIITASKSLQYPPISKVI